jgi:phage repressor protein C with HTH and peptisase S24 domain
VFDPYEEPSSTVVVYRPELRNRIGHDFRALRVGGDSMSPLIAENSIIIVDLSDRVYAKRKIFFVNKQEAGEYVAAVKRVQKTFYGFLLISDNPDYDAETTDMEWKDLG